MFGRNYIALYGFPGGSMVKNPCAMLEPQETLLDPWVRKIPQRKAWQLSPVFLPGETHGQKSLAGYSPQGHKESDKTEATEHALAKNNALSARWVCGDGGSFQYFPETSKLWFSSLKNLISPLIFCNSIFFPLLLC